VNVDKAGTKTTENAGPRRNPKMSENTKMLLDSGLRRNDGNRTFCDFVNYSETEKKKQIEAFDKKG